MSSCYMIDTSVHLTQLIRESVKASIHAAMMASRVTSPVEEEGVKVEGIAEAAGLKDSTRGCFSRS